MATEYKNAMESLGVENHALYNYRIDTLDVTTQLRDVVYKIWHVFDPHVAYVPWRGSRHQDHRAIGDFARQVSWRSNTDVLAYPVVNDMNGFRPNVFSVLDEEAFLTKMDALEQYKSQARLRSWWSLDLVAAFMMSYAPFVDDKDFDFEVEFVEPFEQVKRVIGWMNE